MKTMIYRAFSFMFLCLALVSCKDDFDIQKLQDHPRLVVYCFPTEGDTTLVSVAMSLPVASVKGNVDTLSREKIDAHIIYKVNGVEQTVKRIANEEEAQLFTRSTKSDVLSQLVGQYYVVGKQKAGDKISIQVSAPDFSSVSASTYIPEKVEVELGDVKLEMKSSDGYNPITIDRVEAVFHDNPSSEDYYSVKLRLLNREMDRDLGLLTDNEPLLNKKSKLDDDFGMDDYEYFGNAYIFNDRTINGKTYTLHLDTYSYSYHQSFYIFSYVVDLYKVTPEYYRFLKSINDAQSNSWADVGLMQVTPTYSNVKGGFGVVAGYNISSVSKFFSSSDSEDNGGIYTK